jgi:glycosyltransferase involved in cell wall biosynthesis
MKKILFIVTKPDLGGAQRHVVDLNRYLNSHGWKSIIATGTGTEGELNIFRNFAGTEFKVIRFLEREINPVKDIFALLGIISLIIKEKPDLVSLHSSKAGFIGRIACKLTGTKSLFTAHGWSFRGEKGIRPLFYKLEKHLSPLSQKIICVSEYDRKLGLEFCPPDKLVTIHNGVEDTDQRKSNYSYNNTFNLIMIGRFQIPKDHKLVIQALKKLKNVNCTFIGNGPLLEQTVRRIKEEGMAERIKILENRMDIPELLIKADAFLLASNFEGLPRSIIEAMRAGMPVVASNVGGCPELINHNKNGFLVKPHDEDDLIEKITLLKNDTSLREKFGRRARESYENNFTFELMVSKTINIYDEITAND